MDRRRWLAACLAGVAVVAAAATPAQAIVGGTPQPRSAFPFFVRVILETDDPGEASLCGGTLVAEDFILTAAHCVDEGHSVDRISVMIGEVRESRPIQMFIHPLWNGDAQSDGHDLALLRLRPGVTTGITPVQVGAPFEPSASEPGRLATIVGEGRTGPGQPTTPGTMMAVDTVIHSDGYMDGYYNPWWWFDGWPEQYAIGAGTTYQTVCEGDSGSPLLVSLNNRLVQVGVASFTNDDCDWPAGFMQLDGAQLAWIASVSLTVQGPWRTCPLPGGGTGEAQVSYQNAYFYPAERDGPNYWRLACTPAPPKLIPVPNVVGLPPSAANQILIATGFTTTTPGSTVDCNNLYMVSSQLPPAGTMTALGSPVKLYIGQPPPRPRVCQ